jgi:hypothetical protein
LIRPSSDGRNISKSWVVEGSNDGESWIEIDRRDSDDHLPIWDDWHPTTFLVSRHASVRLVRLRQIGPNHDGRHALVVSAFELFDAKSGPHLGLPDLADLCWAVEPPLLDAT